MLLNVGLSKKQKHHNMLFWICIQGMSIVYQSFFACQIFATMHNHFALQTFIPKLTLIIFIVLILIELTFTIKILKIYQCIEEELEKLSILTNDFSSQPQLRIPTENELLGNANDILTSTPPQIAFIPNFNRSNSS